MHSLSRFLPSSLAVLCALGFAPGLLAVDLTPPVVAKPIPSLTVPLGTVSSAVKAKKTFGLTGVASTSPLVRLNTVLGNIDLALRPDIAPISVTNFLNYLNRGSYNDTFIHRSVPNFVIQGGGYNIVTFDHIPVDPAIRNEHSLPGALPNTVGTISMARTAAPDSATSEWFINTVDNPGLDDIASTNGGYTVFGAVIGTGLDIVNQIAALPTFVYQSPFNEIPLRDFTQADFTAGRDPGGRNFTYVVAATQIPLVPATIDAPAFLRLKASSSNPDLVFASMEGFKVRLTYVEGATGSSTITVKAKSPGGTQVKTTFTVTVQ